MARSTRYLEIIEEENLVENAKVMGEYLKKNLLELGEQFPKVITAIRGRGLLCSFDFVETDPAVRNKFIEKCHEKGLLILPCGKNSIRFRPALDIKKEDIDAAMKILKEVFSLL